MFSFFKKKSPASPTQTVESVAPAEDTRAASRPTAPAPSAHATQPAASSAPQASAQGVVTGATPSPALAPVATAAPATPATRAASGAPSHAASLIGSALVEAIEIPTAQATPPERQKWLDKLKAGLGKTAASISGVFGGSQIDEALYEDLEGALLMADAGVAATQLLTDALRKKVKATGVTHPTALKNILIAELTELLLPLQKPLVIGEHTPTVIMVAGVNGAGKTTSIGKLTKHLADSHASVLLAAADTFRAAAREQLTVWADRNTVDIVSQEGGDPAAVSFDAVSAGKARGKDVVLIDTAGRLPTQLHLMEELKKIKRVIAKADPGTMPAVHGAKGATTGGTAPALTSTDARKAAPHEVLLVIDGNTGQNAVAQVKAFDDALGLTGLIVTKLDGTAKGGVLAAIARERPIPVYFIGVGEKLDELETFNAREFAQALLA